MGNFHETSARADVGIAAVGRNAGYGRRLFDAYTYLCRGKVFANAQTGNIVLFGANIAEGNWLRAAEYFLPILAFALGVVAAEIVKRRYKNARATSTSTGDRLSCWSRSCC